MPEVSRFYGIIVRIFYDDHNPAAGLHPTLAFGGERQAGPDVLPR